MSSRCFCAFSALLECESPCLYIFQFAHGIAIEYMEVSVVTVTEFKYWKSGTTLLSRNSLTDIICQLLDAWAILVILIAPMNPKRINDHLHKQVELYLPPVVLAFTIVIVFLTSIHFTIVPILVFPAMKGPCPPKAHHRQKDNHHTWMESKWSLTGKLW